MIQTMEQLELPSATYYALERIALYRNIPLTRVVEDLLSEYDLWEREHQASYRSNRDELHCYLLLPRLIPKSRVSRPKDTRRYNHETSTLSTCSWVSKPLRQESDFPY